MQRQAARGDGQGVSLDHLGGERQQRSRAGHAERLRGPGHGECVLPCAHGQPAADVCRVFEHLLAPAHLTVEDRTGVGCAGGNLERGLNFADAPHHAGGRACEAFATFDGKGFAGKAGRPALTPPVRLPA